MGDFADMLGIQAKKTNLSISEQAAKILSDTRKGQQHASSKAIKKPKGMKREVFDLLGEDALLPATQTNAAPTFKRKRQVMQGKWIWASIQSSARPDSLSNPVFYHWVKADIHYNDYPYAKYNIHEDKLQYTEEDYQNLLKDENWTKEDTDQVIELAATFSLRWPVIYDRLQLSQPKTIEQVMARYFHIATQLSSGVEKTLPMHGLTIQEKSVPTDFDVEKEAKRRRGQDILFRRTKEDEQEEIRIKDEIKAIDAMLKKNKKQGKNVAAQANIAANSVNSTSAAAQSIANESKQSTVDGVVVIEGKEIVTPLSLTNPSSETYVGPQRNKPCLHSSRLYLTDSNLNISKSLISKMNSYLKELNIPERPIPTKRVCDLVDQVRKSCVTLISLHNQIKKKEKELQAIKTGSSKGTTKNSSKRDAIKTEKVSKPRAPKSKAKAQAGASNPEINPAAPSVDPSPMIAPSLSTDASAFLGSKSELVDLLDVFDRNDSFLDDPLDTFVLDPKKESEITPVKGNKNKRANKDVAGGVSQPKKRSKKAPA